MDPFTAVVNRSEDYLHIVLISTGSVASIKIPLIVKEFLQYRNVKLEVVATKSSLNFYNVSSVRQMGVRVWTDEDEWSSWKKIGDPILHIELRRWADIVLIAPCSANTLAKLAGGICDDLSTSLLRALPPILTPTSPTTSQPAIEALEKPGFSPTVTAVPSRRVSVQDVEKVVTSTVDINASGVASHPPPTLSGAKGVQVWVFPAMNTFMYQHPLTERHLSVVQGVLKYRVVGPIGKGLACGDIGIGAMTEWKEIVKMVVEEYHLRRRLPMFYSHAAFESTTGRYWRKMKEELCEQPKKSPYKGYILEIPRPYLRYQREQGTWKYLGAGFPLKMET